MVKELILDNDKVVLPGLGTFVAEVVPSTFSDKGYTINPPYRKLYFRAKPDEGVALIDFYSTSNNVDREIADKVIRDFVSELKNVLFTRKTVVFPGLGRLRATKENNVFFVADEDLDIYPEGFALEPISLKTHVETVDEVQNVMAELKMMVEQPAVVETEPVVIKEVSEVPAVEEVAPEVIEVVPAVEEETSVIETVSVIEETALVPIKKTSPWKRVLMAVLILVVVAAVALAAFVVCAHYMPELVDQILYTPEELEILNR